MSISKEIVLDRSCLVCGNQLVYRFKGSGHDIRHVASNTRNMKFCSKTCKNSYRNKLRRDITAQEMSRSQRIGEMLHRKVPLKQIAKEMKISLSTIYRLMRGLENSSPFNLTKSQIAVQNMIGKSWNRVIETDGRKLTYWYQEAL